MTKYFQFLSFLLFYSLYYSTSSLAIQYSHLHDQSLLLLAFKESISINQYNSYGFQCRSSYPITNSWNKSTNCCSWDGVTCDEITGDVIELDLSCGQLNGSIHSNSSLFRLPHLQRLNLAWNHIRSSQISMIFGNFSQLAHLNLSDNEFSGQVPSEILKLTELTTLDLSNNEFTIEPDIFKLLLTNFTKLSRVSLVSSDIHSSIPNNLSSSLEFVVLNENDLFGNLPQSIFHLPNLKTLALGENLDLYGLLPSVRWNSYKTLEYLDLNYVQFSGEIPDSIKNLKALKTLVLSQCGLSGTIKSSGLLSLSSLEEIFLSYNHLSGLIPSELSSLVNLQFLSLVHNQLSGPIPKEISSLVNLTSLYLHSNQLSGPVPNELSSLVHLEELYLSSNNFSGHVDINIFLNMKQLNIFSLSHNRLSLVSRNNSTLPTSISRLSLASCNITEIEFLRSPTELYYLDLSVNNITEVSSWLWSKLYNITHLNISYNSIIHKKELNFQQIQTLDISSNLFQGQFPQVPTTIRHMFISNNQFSGIIPSSIVCRLTNLQIFDLSYNMFTGSIPHCIGNMSDSLSILDMHMNKLEGIIPKNISSTSLTTLNLHGNHLRGDIPSSLATCVNLKVLDLGNNNFNASFPSWLGVLPNLTVLSLRFNRFHGQILLSTTNSFSKLKILDVSHNQFTGTLPPMLFQSFSSMTEINETNKTTSYMGDDDQYYKDSTTVMNKGIEIELVRILTTWTTIDLSSNNFEGSIPNSVGSLRSLRQLNFSNNWFTGEIPISFENLSVLESLDVSSNQLTGKIPTQLATMHFLSKLNLSNNHLTGRIPSGPQFQTFENDSYMNNNELCGFPLSETCGGDKRRVVGFSHGSNFIDGFNWRPVLIGYGVGMVLGLLIGAFMFLTKTPKWLMIMVEEEGYRIEMKRNKRKKIFKRTGRKN